MFQATLPVPGRVIPRDPVIEARGAERRASSSSSIGCATCHVPRLPLDDKGWVFAEPNPFNPPATSEPARRPTAAGRPDRATAAAAAADARRDGDRRGCAAYTDFKLHDIMRAGDREARSPRHEPVAVVAGFSQGNCRFLTKRLWGAANEPPFFHHGLFTTLRQAVLAHAGEAPTRRAGRSRRCPATSRTR